MRSHKAGLADLKRLSEAAARNREKAQALARANRQSLDVHSSPNAPGQAQSAQAVSSADQKLFAQTVGSVQALSKQQTRLLLKPVLGTTQSEQLTERRQRAVGQTQMRLEPLSDGAGLPQEADFDTTWAATGIGPSVLRQLARAFWPVGARLDLHGLSSDQARTALATFIENSQSHATRCVCIIHGVGYGSANGQPVLPARVRQWLKQLPAVSAFVQAPKAYGGAGALLALLKLPD